MTEKQKALLRLLDDLAYISSDLSESNKLLMVILRHSDHLL